MSTQKWHDINDPGMLLSSTEEENESPEQEVEEVAKAPAEEKKGDINLVKGTWSAGNSGFEFNKKCKARIEATFVKEPQSKRVTLDTFVKYKGEEENLNQSADVTLNKDGIGECDVTLYYGDKYSQAMTDENADTACQYVFKVKGKNCTNELQSEPLDMPYVPECVKDRQRKKAEANKSASQDGSAACSGECAHCKKRQECDPDPEACEHKETCKVVEKCRDEHKAKAA